MPDSTTTHYPQSYYAATANKIPALPQLQGDAKADVCIVGGGFTGISAALHLIEKGYQVVLLEAGRIGWGASGRNGGQLHSGHRRDQLWLESKLGLELARKLWELAEEAKSTVLNLIDRFGIQCGWQQGLIHAMHKPHFVADDHSFVDHMNSVYGYDSLSKLNRMELAAAIGSEAYFGGSRDASASHLHPLNLVLGLAAAALKNGKGSAFYENSRAVAINTDGEPNVETEHGKVSATAIVLAGNGYMKGLDYESDCHVLPINNFIIATEPLHQELANSIIPGREAVCDSRFVVNYWRLTEDNRLLFGGGETYSRKFPKDIGKFVRPHFIKVYPQLQDAKIDYAWGGTLAVTPNRLPYFRREGNSLYMASGFSGQGVALANFAGKCMADAISGDMERFDTFADLPVPSFPGGAYFQAPILALAMTWFAIRDRL